MAAPIFQRTVVDTQGNVVAGAVVEVRNEATDELAPIFVDRPLTDVKANPFTTDSTGFIRFFAAAGDYRIKATFGAEEIIFRFVQLIDTDELIDIDSAQTLTNKTLTSPALINPSYTGTLTGGTGQVNLGSGQLFKDANGNVGIGTSSPAVRLEVSGPNAIFRFTDTNGGTTDYSNDATGTYWRDYSNSSFRWLRADGNETARLDSNGNVGIGTSSPGAKLDVSGSIVADNLTIGRDTTTPLISLTSDGAGRAFLGYNNADGLTTLENNFGSFVVKTGSGGSSTERMRIDSAGSVGIGTSSPAQKLQVSGADAIIRLADSNGGITDFGSDATGTYFRNFNQSEYRFLRANGEESLRIVSSGNLLVGKSTLSIGTNGFRIDPDGAMYSSIAAGNESLYVYSTSASAFRFFVNAAGTVNATNTTITAISDQRLKENVRELDDGLNVVMALKPRKFDWKEGKGKDIKGDRGFIAQEFEQVLPDMIEEWKDPAPEGEEPYRAVNANLIPTLVKAIQEQQAIIESLKARLDAANI